MKSALVFLGLVLSSSPAAAQQKAIDVRDRFALFSRPTALLNVNRVVCPVDNTGELCFNYLHGPFISRWPINTNNFYVYIAGLQAAAIIGPDGGPWAGDTTGGFFVDLKGTTAHGRPLTEAFSSFPLRDSLTGQPAVEWPGSAWVPSEAPYSSLIRGRPVVSDGAVWWMMWEGDPRLNAGRPHPLGVLVETRFMAFDLGQGLEDVVFFVSKVHNVSASDPAVYAGQRMADTLAIHGGRFAALNESQFGVDLPDGGYTLTQFHLALVSDPDVGQNHRNFSSVHRPLGLAYGWQDDFVPPPSPFWALPPELHASPFFRGTGLTGTVFLQGPSGGEPFAFSNTINGGPFRDPQNVVQLHQYLSLPPGFGAANAGCNVGDPNVTRICLIENAVPNDARYYHSTTPVDLAPGESVTLVGAFVFASPVAIGSCDASAPCNVTPGDLNLVANMHDPAVVAGGVNAIDSIAGFLYATDANGDGRLSAREFVARPMSLYGKTQTARAFADHGFLAPQRPETPEFFLLPGDGRVTVLWQPSPSEQTGDPYFDIAANAMALSPDGEFYPNPLYDPNYRQFDVEGYRVYRSREDDPATLELLAQFDYTGTVISDHGGQINVDRFCAPELAVTSNCPAAYDSIGPGVMRATAVELPLVGPLIQIRFGDREPLVDGSTLTNRADSALTGRGSGYPPLADTEVPFVLVDSTVRNGFRYYYSVTAFDLNSWQSGPSSLESYGVMKSVTPAARATTHQATTNVTTRLVGRGVTLDTAAPMPAIDPQSGVFSGPMPPANGWQADLLDLIPEVLQGQGEVVFRLDSIALGNPAASFSDDRPNISFFTVSHGGRSFDLSVPTNQRLDDNPGATFRTAPFPTIPYDPNSVARYGGSAGHFVQGRLSLTVPGNLLTNGTGRLTSPSRHHDIWSGSYYDGARWFGGAGETAAHPTGGNCAPDCDMTVSGNFNNAGSIPGVTTVYQPLAYTTMNASFFAVQGALGGASRAADIRVYWGPGKVDSVVDLTHNVTVPFKTGAGGSYGFLTITGQNSPGSFDNDPATVSIADFLCLEPFIADSLISPPCIAGQPFQLQPQPQVGPIGFVTRDWRDLANYYGRRGNGFGMYLAGNIFLFELDQLPTGGSWTLRDYAGGVIGGKGTDSTGAVIDDAGPYGFVPAARPLTAVGTEIRIGYDAINRVLATSEANLERVHPVPDPFYFSGGFEQPLEIRFVNLPSRAIVRIYSSSGVLVALMEHDSATLGGELIWSVRNRDGDIVAPGVYFYHIESGSARRVGRMLVVTAER